MPEYIERENLFNLLTEHLEKETGAFSKGFNKGINVARATVHNKEQTPAADVVEVRHGEWWGYICNGVRRVQCSECSAIYTLSDIEGDEQELNYCPYCGAKMDGKGEGG